MTNPEKLKDLFSEAIELGDKEQKQFLSSLDVELAAELSSLIEAHNKSSGFLRPLYSDSTESVDERVGSLIGPYRIVREIAQGGMGEVYEAVRNDGMFEKKVAIKLVRFGTSRRELLRRFNLERQTLAKLEHPGIARLLDGGTTTDGIPYLVMEFVEGRRIDDYCDEHRLSIKERLKLFRIVCLAVEYAHRNLVVHRDIKPGNILVTSEGMPKLLDFGIAKLLATDEAGLNEMTRTGANAYTPEYASPEQVKGESVTTVSDVYSLGVLLYKLLTGHFPHQFKSTLPHDISRSILEEEITAPSAKEFLITAGESNDRIRRTLFGDLDTIIVKALHKEPQRRYGSVEQFSEDINKYLTGFPVLARRDSFGYRAKKYIRRHRVEIIASGLIFLFLIGGVISSMWQAQRAGRERDRAQIETEKAQEVVRVLNEMLSAADRSVSTKEVVTVDEVLDQASRRIETDLVKQPEVAAEVLATIGTAYIGLGLYDKAEEPTRKELELRKLVFGERHPKVAAALHDRAILKHWKEEIVPAESLYKASLAMFAGFGQPSRSFAEALNDYGVLLQERGEYARADSFFLASLKMSESVSAPQHIAAALNNLALDKHWQHDLSAADSLYHRALQLMKQIYGNDNAETATAYSNIAYIAEERGSVAEAESLWRKSLSIREKIMGGRHRDVAVDRITLADFLQSHTSNYAEAEGFSREAIGVLESQYPHLDRLISKGEVVLAKVLQKEKRIREAEIHFCKAIERISNMQPANVKMLAETELLLAENLSLQKRKPEAHSMAQKSYASYRELLGEQNDATQHAKNVMLTTSTK